jgi:hypothetical protein
LNCKFQEIDHGDPSAGIEREKAGQEVEARSEAREEGCKQEDQGSQAEGRQALRRPEVCQKARQDCEKEDVKKDGKEGLEVRGGEEVRLGANDQAGRQIRRRSYRH